MSYDTDSMFLCLACGSHQNDSEGGVLYHQIMRALAAHAGRGAKACWSVLLSVGLLTASGCSADGNRSETQAPLPSAMQTGTASAQGGGSIGKAQSAGTTGQMGDGMGSSGAASTQALEQSSEGMGGASSGVMQSIAEPEMSPGEQAPPTQAEPAPSAPQPEPATPEPQMEPTAPGPDGGVESESSATPDGPAETDGCPLLLEGWGKVSGEAVDETTGGEGGETVRPTNAQELSSYAGDGQPRIIEIEGTFDVPRLDIASNKTLVGIGADATLNGGLVIRGSSQSAVTNVIIQNLHINGVNTGGEDAVQVQYAHHLWFDHCDIYDGPDGNLDMTHAVNWSTISWTIFRYTSAYHAVPGETGDHRFSNLIGHSDSNAAEDRGRLKISLHHNWWSDGVRERMPRVRFGEVHVYNNYYSSSASEYCVGAGSEAHLLLENNYFDGVHSPQRYINTADQGTANVTERGSVYSGTSGDQVTGGGGTPFTDAPYDFQLDDAESIPELVQRCSGPR